MIRTTKGILLINSVLCFILLISYKTSFCQESQQLTIPVKNASSITYSPDNQYFAIAKGPTINLYNAGNDTRITTITTQTNSKDILDITFNNTGTFILAACGNKTVKLISIPSGKVLAVYSGHLHPVVAARFAQGDRTVITLGEDGTVKAYDRELKTEIYSISSSQKTVRAFDVSPDGRYFVVGGAEQNILLYESATGKLLKKWHAHNNWIRSLAFSPDSQTIASGGDDKMIYLWETETGNKKLELPQRGWIYDLEFSLDGKFIGAALEKTAIHFYNINSGNIALKLADFKSPVLKLAISPTGQQVACTYEYGSDVILSDIRSLNITPVVHFKDTKDATPPLILVSNPANITDNKTVVYKDLIDLRGLVTDDSGIRSLKINGQETPVRQNGNFLINIPLAMGDNFITMEVSDVNENIALKKFVIIRKSMEGEAYYGADAVNHLFVVGINNYSYWPKLNNAVKDANDVVSVLLSRYRFDFEHTIVIKDEMATRTNIYNGLRSLIEKVGPKDNLVIYFSGHGFFDQLLNEGYWIPYEAHTNSAGEYVSNTDILKLLNAINSQHTFLIADACFSGALFSDSRRGYTEQVEKFKSRWGLASGRLETVSDGAIGGNSPFAKRILEFLNTNQKDKFAISELIQFVKTQVAEDTNQTPIGNPLKALGDEGGEMVFYLRKN